MNAHKKILSRKELRTRVDEWRRAGEAITEFILALHHKWKISDLARAIRAYPTYSTPVQQLAAEMDREIDEAIRLQEECRRRRVESEEPK